MDVQCRSRLIERPSGLSGYRPGFWCAVCGRKVSLQTDKRCTTEGCPYLCHVHCLMGEEEFNCGNTGQLRASTGITDPVTFTRRDAQGAPQTPTTTDQADHQDLVDDLIRLEKEDLVQLVRSLRKELASTKAQLTHYRSTTTDLGSKRCVLVEALDVVDTLLATHASEDIVQKTVACTAREDKIDAATVPTEQESRENSSLPPPQPPNTPQPPDTPPPPSSRSPSPRRESDSAETHRGHIAAAEETRESGRGREHSSLQTNQINTNQPQHPKRKKRKPKKRTRQETPQQATPHPGQQQASRCEVCKRWGHTTSAARRKGVTIATVALTLPRTAESKLPTEDSRNWWTQ